MKKIILILIAFFSFYCAYGASSNGTIVAGYYIIQDFEGSTTLTVNKSANITATVFTPHPANSTYCAKVVSSGNNGDVYFTFPVSLPTGINLVNFDTLFYDFYIGGASYKKSYIYIGTTKVHDMGSNYLNGTNVNKGTLKIPIAAFNQTGAATAVTNAGNSFALGWGCDQGTSTWYVDNVKLSYKLTTAPTTTAASNITTTSFIANWAALWGIENYQLDVSTQSNFSTFIIQNQNIGNVTTYTVSGLSPNTTYYYRVRGHKSNNQASVNISPNSNTITVTTTAPQSSASDYFRSNASGNYGDISTWQSSSDNSNWISATLAPTSSATSTEITSGHTVIVSENTTVSNLTINSGAVLNVGAGKQFTVSGNLSNSGTLELLSNENGTATILTNGSLSGSGTYKVNQYLTAGRNWYFSSPISNATSAVVKSAEGNQLWERNVSGNSWPELTATNINLTPAKGYIAKTVSDGVITFSGELNNGTITPLQLINYAVPSGKFHLVGNPYPSYLDWQAVSEANPNLSNTMWYRTKTAVTEQNPTSLYTFSTVQYTSEAGWFSVSGNANTTITKKIPPMQAFWVRIKDGIESVDFTLNNNMRSDIDETGNRYKAPATNNQTIRLQVSNNLNTDETLLYFNNSASDNFDRFDSPKMFNNSITIPEIYTKIGNEQLVINGMNSYNRVTSIPLGFNAGQAGTYTIHATNIQNFDVNTRIILFDNETQSEFDLTEGKLYEFKSEAVKTDYRFQIRFKFISGSTANESTLLNDINVHTLNRHIYIQLNSSNSIKTKARVFNSLGHCIYNQTLFQQSTQLEKSFDTGLYFIVIDAGEESLIRKIIVY